MPAKRGQRDTGDERDVRDVHGPLSADAEIGPAPHTWDGLVSVAEYRDMMSDFVSSDAIIIQRLDYIERLCRSVVRTRFERLYTPIHDP